MGKVNRKDFLKSNEIVEKTGKSHVEFVNYSKRIHKFLLQEIEDLQKQVKHLNSHFVCETCNPPLPNVQGVASSNTENQA